ncbi:MAG: acyloxyacyl hydrolase [Bacteroidetes bacterium]|nr:acyloxyacyl hydrolase [Bacteroidota bacterium]MCH8233623.1 acyloxyacyl hydrolase [Bacteroidota bacterium]
MNAGFRFTHPVNFVNKYWQTSTGPHYISADFPNGENGIWQCGKFIFSDNLVLGLSRHFTDFQVNIETRLRHMSNASLKVPNKGINNVIFLVVIGKII